jgi:RNA polymerase sigma-70 factor (ECF subfamily)
MEKLTPEQRQWISDQVLPWEPSIRNWLRWRARVSAEELDDLIQEGYSRLCDVADVSRIAGPRQYFRRILWNQFVDNRRRARVVPIESKEELGALPIEEPLGPERRVGARQEYELLLQAVKALSPQQRAVFEFKNFQDLSVDEISRRMRIGKKTVHTYLQRARAQIVRSMYGNENTTYRAGEGKRHDEEQNR